VETLDIAVFLSRAVGKFTQQYYNEFCHEFPAAWKYTDKLLAMKVVLNGMHTMRTPLIQEKFDSYMRKYNPDIIISVFPWWSVFLDQFFRKSTKKIPLAILITDSINIHPFWYANIEKYVDRFFVIDNFSKEILEKNLKQSAGKVITSFFPIEKELFITKKDIHNQKIVLVLS
jgi:UDP-N-acetylglucosamine:LPS N-acetylglucosamine transferase